MNKKIIDFEEGWAEMKVGIAKLKNLLEGDPNETQFTSKDYMNMYTMIYNMCTQKPPHDYSAQLYERYKESFNSYLASTVMPAMKEKEGESMLRDLVYRWGNHKVMVRWLSRFFNYIDRYYVIRHSLLDLHDVGIQCFRDLVYSELKATVKDAVVDLINREREGEVIDRILLKNVVQIFVDIGMGNMDAYQEDFENHLLPTAARYYEAKSARWIAEDSTPQYLVKAEECINAEKTRVENYLHRSSEDKLLRVVESELLAKYEETLLNKENSGCRCLLRNNKVDDLSRLYRLFLRVPQGLDPIGVIFRQHITDEGMDVLKLADQAAQEKNKENPVDAVFVKNVLDLHDRFLHFVAKCFASNSLFHKALKEAFEIFCNKPIAGCTCAELLATYCNGILQRGSSEKMDDQDIELTVEKVVKLLAYISDKDLFGEFHRKRLARRLLYDKSTNDDHERLILSQLKTQCGAQFTSRMEGMLKDLQLAREGQATFQAYLDDHQEDHPGLELSVSVLTTGFWPTYKSMDLALPKEMVRCIEVFRKHYDSRTNHRKLSWIYSLGHCQVRANFEKKQCDLVIHTFQAAVVLLFNSADRLSYEEIKTQTNLPDDDAARVLHSLSCAKYKILVKEPSNREVKPGDVFTFNASFTDKQRRIKIQLPVQDDKKKTVAVVDQDRRYAIDAALVRIMKSRKVLQHQQLQVECAEQLSKMFKPDFKMIKKRIEDLIQREYLERDKENPNLFKYLA